MNANEIVVAPGDGPISAMALGRKSVLKLQNGNTEQNVMMFEEAAPASAVTAFHIHYDSDEVVPGLAPSCCLRASGESLTNDLPTESGAVAPL